MMRNYWAERKPGHVPCLALSLSRSGGVTVPIHLADDTGAAVFLEPELYEKGHMNQRDGA